jgi:hypothetical protein
MSPSSTWAIALLRSTIAARIVAALCATGWFQAISGNTVVCPLHGWKVDLTSGAIVKPEVPVCVDVYPVKVENGVVLVDFPTHREQTKEAAA